MPEELRFQRICAVSRRRVSMKREVEQKRVL
jgi:hypothetical protein